MTRRDERCPPVPLRVQVVIPTWSTKMFMLAASEGRLMNGRGTYDNLTGERPIGVRVAKVHRDRVLEHADVKLRQWQKATKEWAALGLAHRCGRGELFMAFKDAADGCCFHCRQPLEAPSEDASTRTQKVHNAHSEGASYVQTREPSVNTKREHVGVQGVQGSQGPRDSQGVSTSRAPAESDDAIRSMGFEPTPDGWVPIDEEAEAEALKRVTVALGATPVVTESEEVRS